MKVWEKYLADAQADLEKQYKDFADSLGVYDGCRGISCQFCPLSDDTRACRDIPKDEVFAILNKEYVETQNEQD